MDGFEEVLEHFPLDVYSPRRVEVGGLGAGSTLYRVEGSPLLDSKARVFLLDTPQGREIACHPHIVSHGLSTLCLEAAQEFRVAFEGLGLEAAEAMVVQILRGGPGYMVDKVFPEVPLARVRALYTSDGYRSHSDDPRKVSVPYSLIPPGEAETLILPDTYATGRSAEAALTHLHQKGLEPSRVVIYGFMSAPAVERLQNLLETWGSELWAFAICDLSPLCSNHYDMPLYGLDEPLWRERGMLKPLGSVVAPETLRGVLPHYIPGLDQPGDWSERHDTLDNGYGWEAGDIRGHLERSLRLIQELDRLNSGQPWYTQTHQTAAKAEIARIQKTLQGLP